MTRASIVALAVLVSSMVDPAEARIGRDQRQSSQPAGSDLQMTELRTRASSAVRLAGMCFLESAWDPRWSTSAATIIATWS